MALIKSCTWAMLLGFLVVPQAHAQMGGGMSPTPSGPSAADATVPFQKGVAAFKAGDYPKAIRELRTARSANLNDGNIPYVLGLAYAASGKKPEAKQAFQSAVRTGNAPVPAHLQLALVALELGDRETAQKQYAALERKLGKCGSKCSDADRAELSSAMEQLARGLGTQ